jgi:hypothetical protein
MQELRHSKDICMLQERTAYRILIVKPLAKVAWKTEKEMGEKH